MDPRFRGDDKKMAATITTFICPNVYVRQNWADAWVLEPLLSAIGSISVAAPGIGTANFLWDYGYRTVEGNQTFYAAGPFAYLGWFVQIRATVDAVATELWTGRFLGDLLSIDGAVTIGGQPVAGGQQIYEAVELSYLLDREVIRQAKAEQGGLEVSIDRVPMMNSSDDRGISEIGNRANSANADGIYRYSADGAVWSHRQFLAMMLWDNRPDGIRFQLTGQEALLDDVASCGRVEGLTLLMLLDGLIDRRRGFTWKIAKVGFGRDPAVGIEVATVFDEEITVGDVTLSPSANIIDIELGNVHANRIVQMNLIDANRFDTVRVRGDLVTSCFTIDWHTFDPGWTSAEEGYYKDGAKNESGYGDLDEDEQIKENERYRAQPRYDQVYRQWRMPLDWDWRIENYNVNPACDTDGGLAEDGTGGYEAADYFNDGRHFLRKLPLKRGWDYTGATPVDRRPPDTISEYCAPMVWVEYEGKFHKVSKLSEIVVDDDGNKSASCGVTMLDNMMGFSLSASPGHEFASGHFEGAEPAGSQPIFNWEDLIATVAVQTDQRVEVVVEAETPIAGGGRTLIIDLPYAQLWWINKGTVVGVNAAGAKEIYGGASQILRNDKYLLEAVAAAAIGWYGKRRQTLTVTVAYLTDDAKVGDLIRSVAMPAVYDEINTVVTQVVHDYVSGETTIATNFSQLDFAAIPQGNNPGLGSSNAGSGGAAAAATATATATTGGKRAEAATVGGGGAGSMESGAGSLMAEIAKLKEELGDIPVEAAVTGGGGTAASGIRIAEVASNATGGGYYNCYLQKFDADDWKTNTDPFDNDGALVEVLNIPEAGKTDIHQLAAGAKLAVWRQMDDGAPGKMRWLGVEITYIYKCT